MTSTRSTTANATATTTPTTTEAIDLLRPTVADWSVSTGALTEVLEGLDRERVSLSLVIRDAAGQDPGSHDSVEGEEAEGHLAANGRLVGLEVLRDLGLDVDELQAAHEPSPSRGRRTTVPFAPGSGPVRRIQLLGLGDGSLAAWRAVGAEFGRATRGEPHAVVLLPANVTDLEAAAFVESATLGGWSVPRLTAAGWVATARPASTITITSTRAGLEPPVRDAVVRARATLLARCLGITPSNIKNPGWMAAQARTLARRSGLAIKVWTEKDLAREGFGGLLAVGGGSATPPRLVQLDWTPKDPTGGGGTTQHVVLVGKGITFDTGGLNIKPADGMLAMKTDMMGAAAVLATLTASRDLDVPVRVTGLLALAENAVSGSAYRPSDVVTHYGGITTEIGNTDAEGRIVLADALAYAAQTLRPDVIVDIATLTGAARVALARAMAPVFANDDTLREALTEASVTVGETLWPLPLHAAYRAALDSDVADVKQFSSVHGGGSIMAALFLEEFVGGTPWAHLDIAGPGRSDVDAGVLAKGATGFGTRVLLRWLEGLG